MFALFLFLVARVTEYQSLHFAALRIALALVPLGDMSYFEILA